MSEVLGRALAETEADDVFADLGFDSVGIVDLAARLSDDLGYVVSPTDLIDHPTIARLSAYLSREPSRSPSSNRRAVPQSVSRVVGNGAAPTQSAGTRLDDHAVAIVGMSGRFPAAPDLRGFWRLLRAGHAASSEERPERWEASDADAWGDDPRIPAAFLEEADAFDAGFFRLTPGEALAMDPQQRLSLMESWRALEDAGLTGARSSDRTTGVFVGARSSGYESVLARAGYESDSETLLGNDLSLLAARISYFCDLQGPSLVVDTACSSSLVAVHLACESLRAGECAIALAGGVGLTNHPSFLLGTHALGVLSPTGVCRPFDADADGFVHGEGIGFVVLRPLADALAEGDAIYAVVRGTAVNQDGRSNGVTAPNGEAQSALQRSLYRRIGIDPATISYVEAHGTGTRLGDPVEVSALARSLAEGSRSQPCVIGSVKPNIGHVTAAAGIAGLIKTALCLHHRELVPTLHFRRPNPLIDLERAGFHVGTSCEPWPAGDEPRRAAVNSLGIGGTNAHCVLEEAPRTPEARRDVGAYPLQVTARTPDMVEPVAERLLEWARGPDGPRRLVDLSYTLMVGRRRFDHGVVCAVSDLEDARAALARVADGGIPARGWRIASRAAPGTPPTVSEAGPVSDDPSSEERDLDAACASFAAGGRPDWHAFYAGRAPRIVRPPGYPFDPKRYWPSTRTTAPTRAETTVTRRGRRTEEEVQAAVHEVVHAVMGPEAAAAAQGGAALSALGLDSLRGLRLQHRLERRLGAALSLERLLSDATIAEIAEELRDTDTHPDRGVAAASDDPDPETAFPLTELQAGYFVAKQTPEVDPVGCHAYIEFLVPELDVDRLETAWGRLLDIHPMLRARVGRDGRQATPTEAPRARFHRYRLSPDPGPNDRHLEEVRREMSHRVYRPDDWPLFEIRVTEHGGGAPARVHVSMDGWIADAASAEIIYRQWRLLYESPDRAVSSPRATFRAFARSASRAEATTGSVEYWAQKLANAPPSPTLPARSVAARSEELGHRERMLWRSDPAVWERLKASARRAKVSPSILLLRVLADRLHDGDAGDRFSLALTVRRVPLDVPGIEDVVGPFTSTSIFIAERRPGTSLDERLRLDQQQLARDLEHGDVSGISAWRRAAAGPPPRLVFTSTVEATPAHASEASDAEPARWLDDVVWGVSQTPGVDLHVQVSERRGTLQVVWDVAKGRLETRAIRDMFESSCSALEELVATPDAELDEHPGDGSVGDARIRSIESSVPAPNESIPLTPLQMALLAQRTIEDRRGAGAGYVYREFELGRRDVETVQARLDGMMRRSPMLRAALRRSPPRLMPCAVASYRIRIEDFRSLESHETAERLETVRTEMTEDATDGAGWPPFDIRAFLLDGDRARLHVRIDLLLGDAFSVWLFYRDLLRDGDAGDRSSATDREPHRPGPTYAAYAAARARYRETTGYAADQRHWRRALHTLPSGPSWPRTDDAAEPRFVRRSLVVDEWAAIERAAERSGAAPRAIPIAVYAEALRRSCGGSDVTVGVVSHPLRETIPELTNVYGDCSSLSWIPTRADRPETVMDAVSRIADQLELDHRHDWGDPFE
ncbi:MAG: condensation domain-containing protein, partial [Gemmatimonadetes bacterium]|nr:condensation domain-containing protein [Gemmatimonadota bacterium]